MACPHCSSSNFIFCNKKTKLGYQIYYCNNCNRQYNERTLSPFNLLQITTETLFEILVLRLRYKVSLRDVAEIYLARGICFSHNTLADWESKFYPLLANELQTARQKEATNRWKVDEVMVKVGKEWHYLYRGIDSEGKLVDVRLSKERSLEATSAYFEQVVATTQVQPTEITSDKNKTYPKAIKQILGRKVKHRKNKYLNNKLLMTTAKSNSGMMSCSASKSSLMPSGSAGRLKKSKNISGGGANTTTQELLQSNALTLTANTSGSRTSFVN